AGDALGFGLRPVRHTEPIVHRRASHRRRRDPATHGEEPRRIRDGFVSQLVRKLRIGAPSVEAHAQGGRDAVVRVALQMVDHELSCELSGLALLVLWSVHPRWLWMSISAGMTVFPVRSTRV